MAAVSGVYVMRDAVVTLNAIEYANQCVKVQFVPDVPIQSQRTLVPDGTVQDVDSAIWTVEMTILQKNDAGGLAKALRDAEPGEEVDITFAPKAGTGNAKADATVKMLPVAFGGEQGGFNNLELVLPVVGAPTFGTLS
jgi:hypothetical protein